MQSPEVASSESGHAASLQRGSRTHGARRIPVLGGWGLMLSFGCRFKKDNTECLAFGNVTKSHDHLNPMLGSRPRTLQKKGP